MTNNVNLSDASQDFITQNVSPYMQELRHYDLIDVVYELLMFLDRNAKCPSVVYDLIDNEYDDFRPYLGTLADVSLQTHSFNVARNLINEVKKYFGKGSSYQVPWALITGLGHDIGKAFELRDLAPYSINDHQITSSRKLMEFLAGKNSVIAQRVIVAVDHHHSFAEDNPWVNMLKNADHAARNSEFAAVNSAFQNVVFNDWFKISDLYSSIEPEINRVNSNGRWNIFIFHGVIYCTPDFLFDTVRKLCMQNNIADVTFLKKSSKFRALKIITTHLKEIGAVYEHIKPGMFARNYQIYFYVGRTIRVPHIPLKPHTAYDLVALEKRKMGILQIIRAVIGS